MSPRIVIDTNVLIAALRSRNGASYRLLELVDSGLFQPCVSVPLILEYEEVAMRLESTLTSGDITSIIDYICQQSHQLKIHFLWRPFLKDPHDDMILELAVSGQCQAIVTYNIKDFRGAETFGIQVLTPKEFLQQIGAIK